MDRDFITSDSCVTNVILLDRLSYRQAVLFYGSGNSFVGSEYGSITRNSRYTAVLIPDERILRMAVLLVYVVPGVVGAFSECPYYTDVLPRHPVISGISQGGVVVHRKYRIYSAVFRGANVFSYFCRGAICTASVLFRCFYRGRICRPRAIHSYGSVDSLASSFFRNIPSAVLLHFPIFFEIM